MPHPIGKGWCAVVALLATGLGAGMAEAKNPPLSDWTTNLSERTPAEEGQLADHDPQLVVAGATVHVTWITDVTGSQRRVMYRRSTDGGLTWGPRLALFEDDDVGSDRTGVRMAVVGSRVHVVAAHYDGSWYGVLSYVRSTDGGASFEAPRALFSAAGAWHVYDTRISASSGHVTIGFRNQCNWCVDNQYLLLDTTDGGSTFATRTAYATNTGASWGVGDLLRTSATNLSVLYGDWSYYYGMVYGRLYVAASTDNGATFTSTRVSGPSASGEDKALPLQDAHYVPKLAISGARTYAVWTGLDDADVAGVYFRRSTDQGLTFRPAVNLTAGVLPPGEVVSGGQETVTASGAHVVVAFASQAGNVYVRRSTNSGVSWMPLVEQTAPAATPHVGTGWWPVVRARAVTDAPPRVDLLWNCATYRGSADAGASFGGPALLTPQFSWANLGCTRPHLAVGTDGAIHAVFEGQVFGADADVFYRRHEAPPAPEAVDLALTLAPDSAALRYDTMQVAPRPDISFTGPFSAEIRVRPAAGSSRIARVLTREDASSRHYDPAAYQIGTYEAGGARRASGGVRTSDGPFMAWGTHALPDGQWSHLALTYDPAGGADNLRLYVDGELSATGTATGSTTAGAGLLFVGACAPSTDSFAGDVDEVRLWDRTLSPIEIQAGRSGPLVGDEPGLVAYWSLDGTTRDLTGKGHDGVLMYQERFHTAAPLALSIADASVTEPDTGSIPAVFTVTLSPPHPRPVSVTWATADGSARAGRDYAASGGVLLVPAGATAATLEVPVLGDVLDEAKETFQIVLSSPTEGVLADGSATGSVIDDDPLPHLSITDRSLSEGDSGTKAAWFVVTLDAPSGRKVTVQWSTAPGSATAGEDYVAGSGALTFSPGVTQKAFAIAIQGDTADEGDEAFEVQLQAPTQALVADGTGLCTIRDDDP